MATNVTIRGLNDKGFRVNNNSGVPTEVKIGTTVTVNVDDPFVARILQRHNDNWIVANGATATIRGLSTGTYAGFKINNNSGTPIRVLSNANTVVTVGDAATARRLRRNKDNWVVANGSTVVVRGLDRQGFRIKTNGGALARLKLGTSVTINLADRDAAKTLKRTQARWIETTAV